MDYYEVKPLTAPVQCSLEVPGSKSITNRALLIAALADGRTRLDGVLFSDDVKHFIKSLQALGFELAVDEKEKRVDVCGTGGRIPRQEAEIDVGSAGTAARFLTALLGVSEGTYVIQASEQMKKRPMHSLFLALENLGARISFLEQEDHLPVRITGSQAHGAYKTIQKTELDISESTQFLSAFLLIAPLFGHGLNIHISSRKKDGSYVRITRQMMRDFGIDTDYADGIYRIRPDSTYKAKTSWQIEPDVSAACYFYAAAAVSGGYARVQNVHFDMMQGDRRFLGLLEQMGCRLWEENAGVFLKGPDRLKGISVDMNDFSDQALTLAAVAPYAAGPVEITNIEHIRHQECDRIHAIAENLRRAGIRVDEEKDGVRIWPGQPHACEIETYEDHRVAMAFSLLGLKTPGIRIKNPGCCAKTFPDYFEKFELLYQR